MTARSLDLGELSNRISALLDTDVTGIEQIVGGNSSLTYSAFAGGRRVAIKAAPPGLEPVRNRDVLRQARILSFLAGCDGVAVPEVLTTDDGAPPEIPPLFVMTFVEGESHEPNMSPEVSPAADAEIEARAFAAGRMAAALHALDSASLGAERVGTIDGEVARWERAFSSVEQDLRFDSDEIRDLLLENLPHALEPTVIHGDWRLGNMLCAGTEILAVIDWEIWSITDPRIDLAWFLLMADPAHPACVRRTPGMPSPEALLSAYEEAAGKEIEQMPWFAALVHYKQAAVAALIVKNNRRLAQPGIDAAKMQAHIPDLLDAARKELSS